MGYSHHTSGIETVKANSISAKMVHKHKTIYAQSFLARLLILIKKGGLLQLKFGVVGVGVGVGVNIYLWAR